ncbi:SCO4225 family membrane protein [Streptomyces thermocarboxydus]
MPGRPLLSRLYGDPFALAYLGICATLTVWALASSTAEHEDASLAGVIPVLATAPVSIAALALPGARGLRPGCGAGRTGQRGGHHLVFTPSARRETLTRGGQGPPPPPAALAEPAAPRTRTDVDRAQLSAAAHRARLPRQGRHTAHAECAHLTAARFRGARARAGPRWAVALSGARVTDGPHAGADRGAAGVGPRCAPTRPVRRRGDGPAPGRRRCPHRGAAGACVAEPARTGFTPPPCRTRPYRRGRPPGSPRPVVVPTRSSCPRGRGGRPSGR